MKKNIRKIFAVYPFLSDYKSEEVEYESIITQLREFTNTELLEIENTYNRI